MQKRTRILLVIVAATVLLTLGIGFSASQAAPPADSPDGFVLESAPGVDLPWDVLGGGAARMAGGEFVMLSTVGQPAISAELGSASYRVTSGFWAGAPPWLRTLLPVLWR